MNPPIAHSRTVRAIHAENRRLDEAIHNPADREIPLKQWVHEEAERLGISPSAVHQRISKGKYPWLRRRYESARVVYVPVEDK